MKKLLLGIGLLIGSSSAMAANVAPYIQKCTDPKGSIITCTMSNTPGSSFNSSNPGSNLPNMEMPGGGALNFVAPDVNGSYDSRYPGDIFAFCNGGRPSRKSPKRPIYDSICPKGKM